MFSPGPVRFDKSSKIYTTVLLVVTTLFSVFVLFNELLGRIVGAILIAVFTIYVASIAYAIYKGIVTAPDDDSDSGIDTPLNESDFVETTFKKSRFPSGSGGTILQTMSSSNVDYTNLPARELFKEENERGSLETELESQRKMIHSTRYHIIHLMIGLLALSLSGYILSHSLKSLAISLSLSTTVLGTTVLSIATTLPEKLIAILSGKKKQGGIIVANTTGSNIFLLTLCAGVLFLLGDLGALKQSVGVFEVACMLASSVILCGIAFVGGWRWMGWGLLGLYLAFLVGEFLMVRR